MASGDLVSVIKVLEPTYKVTPTDSPDWARKRITGEDLTTEPQTEDSEEINGINVGDTDAEKVGETASGGYQFEMSAANFDDDLEDVLMGTWTADELVPAYVERSYSIEKRYGDIVQHILYRGMVANSLTLNFNSRSKITGSVSYSGADAPISATSAVGAGTVTEPADNKIMRTGNTITGVLYNGAPIAGQGIRVKDIVLTIERSQEPEDVVDSDSPSDIIPGQPVIGLELNVYFDNQTIYNNFTSGSYSSFAFTSSDAAGNSYEYEFPRIFFTNANPDGASKNTSILLPASGRVLRDPAVGVNYMMKVTRTIV